jgi:hypothetical protein
MYALILIGRGADEASDYAVIGAISFALTVVNIVCIWFSGMAMFTLKVSCVRFAVIRTVSSSAGALLSNNFHNPSIVTL